jgi:hypothetical protein
MATWYLINTVTVALVVGQPDKLLAGTFIDDAKIATAGITAAGGVLWPSSDSVVAAAAVATQNAQKNQGLNEDGSNARMAAATFASLLAGPVAAQVTHLTIDVPLATIQAQTSGTAFNVGAVLPANARLLATAINVITPLSGGSAASAVATLQGGTDSAGSLVASTTVFTGAQAVIATPGSNPYAARGGQQLKMTITGDGTHALSTLTAGHLAVDLYYSVLP